jgi:hypothetical protein
MIKKVPLNLFEILFDQGVVTVTKENYFIVHELANKFRNEELDNIFFDFQPGDDVNESNVVLLLRQQWFDHLPIDEEVAFIHCITF